jgi:hypothetical protein
LVRCIIKGVADLRYDFPLLETSYPLKPKV